MIQLYQGIDIVQVAKLRTICRRHSRFLQDAFTERERQQCFTRRDPYVHLAGRFAAKEACLKALGTGFTEPGNTSILSEIEVITHHSGRPILGLCGWAKRLCDRKAIAQLTVSISHTEVYAVSTVILLANMIARQN